MLKVQEIRELIKLVDQSSLNEFTYENEDTKIEMKKNSGAVNVQQAAPQQPAEIQAAPQQAAPQPSKAEEKAASATAPAAQQAAADDNLHQIISPMVGTFYHSPSPDQPAYVQPGSVVQNDTVVCIVEAMKLFNEIEAEVNGEIVEILVKDGQLVEYGQPLFLVKAK